ncbi:MAG: hypothetical protein ACK5NQ_02740 [Pseudomonas sp.]
MEQVDLSWVSPFLAFTPIVMILLFFSYASAVSEEKEDKFYNFFYNFNPRRGLASQWPLRFWLTTIVVYAFATGYMCWVGYSLDFTPKGFSVFIEISKFPLAVLSLTIPVGVFISRLHSTQQTATQIEVTDSKNRLDAFHSQRKGLVEYIESVGEIELAPKIRKSLRINQAFHSVLFPNSSHTAGANEADEEAVQDVVGRIEKVMRHLAHLAPSDSRIKVKAAEPSDLSLGLHYVSLMLSVRDLCDHLKVTDYALDSHGKRRSIGISGGDVGGLASVKKLELPGANYREILAILNYCCTVTYYAVLSEHREKYSLRIIRIKNLYHEVRALCVSASIDPPDDMVSKLSKAGRLDMKTDEFARVPELS